MQRLRWTLAALAVLSLLIFFIAGFWYFRNRTVEQDRQRILREVQISQMRPKFMGWFSNNWSQLESAAKIRKDQALVEQAACCLTVGMVSWCMWKPIRLPPPQRFHQMAPSRWRVRKDVRP